MTIYQVTHKMRWLGQEVRNVYYYETIDAEPSALEWDDIVDEIRGDFDSLLKTILSQQWAFWGIDYRVVSSPGLLSFEALPTAGELVGTSATDDVATQVALLISVKGVTTKPNRARTYLSGMTQGQVNDSLFAAGVRADAEEFIDMQSVLNAAGVNELQRVAAEWNNGHTQVVASNNIAGRASKASLVPATQRRRRIGVGM
jgi:hypothetical protein